MSRKPNTLSILFFRQNLVEESSPTTSKFGTNSITEKATTDSGGDEDELGVSDFRDLVYSQMSVDFLSGFVWQLRSGYSLELDRTGPEPSCHLYVANLDDTVGDFNLRDEFSAMGAIRLARVARTDGYPHCFGLISFTTTEALVRAEKEMHGRLFRTKRIFVAIVQVVRGISLEQWYLTNRKPSFIDDNDQDLSETPQSHDAVNVQTGATILSELNRSAEKVRFSEQER